MHTASSPSSPSRPCPACAGTRIVDWFASEDFMLEKDGLFRVGRCPDCGLAFQTHPPAYSALKAHYPEAYTPFSVSPMRAGLSVQWNLRKRLGYGHLPEMKNPGWLRRWNGAFAADTQLFPRFVAGGKLLEIGCAAGNRLTLLQSLGWDHCAGIEWNDGAARSARERGLDVLTGRVEDALAEFADESLDVVIASFVLEHLENPFEVVRQIASKLKPEGQFLFSTVDIGSPEFRMYGRYWYSLDLPRHLVFFRGEDIHRLLGPAFGRITLRHKPSAEDFLGSARYRARRKQYAVDVLILRAKSILGPLCQLLARLGQGSRITVRCAKALPEQKR